jgi:glucose 1-dehydrogenase
MSALTGYRALVTGASSGIGQGVAIAFGEAGAQVAVNYRSDADGAQEAVEQIEAAGGTAYAVQADVSDPDAVTAMVAEVCERFGGLDVLVANAGLQKDAATLEMSVEDWRTVLDVNLTGQFLCAQAAARRMVEQGAGAGPARSAGSILMMSSVHDVIPWAGHVNYAASKGGIDMLMRTMAQELAPQKVRVNAISPGAIRTPINEDAWSTPEAERELLQLIPYGRVGVVDDVASAAVWLASDAADYVTGTTLYVDGGMTTYPAFRDGG